MNKAISPAAAVAANLAQYTQDMINQAHDVAASLALYQAHVASANAGLGSDRPIPTPGGNQSSTGGNTNNTFNITTTDPHGVHHTVGQQLAWNAATH